MKDFLNSENTSHGLRDLIEEIHTGYYETINLLCNNISRLIKDINAGGIRPENTAYISAAKTIVAEAEKYIAQRMLIFIPYINALVQKDMDGHNCSTCSGICELQHREQLISFSEQQQRFKEHMTGLTKVSSKIYKRDEPENLKALHNKMTLLHNMVAELLYMEEDALLPKIVASQKNIYALR